MAAFKKSYGIALAVVALSLTLMGVVLAATDPNPSGIGKDVLVLNGIPPRSTSLLVTVSNGQSYTVSATINVNFDTSSAEAIVQFPLLFSQTSVELRMVGDHVYAEAADISSGKWLEIDEHPPSFFGIALELTQPASDLNLIKASNTSRSRRADIQRPIASRATTSRSPMCSARPSRRSSARSTSR